MEIELENLSTENMYYHDLFRQFIEDYYRADHPFNEQYGPELIPHLIDEAYKEPTKDTTIALSLYYKLSPFRSKLLSRNEIGYDRWSATMLAKFKDYIHNTKYIVDRDLVNIIQI